MSVIIDKLKTLDKCLDKLDAVDRNKFLFSNFKEVNKELETVLDEFILIVKTNKEIGFSENENTLLVDMVNKIVSLEARFLPKSDIMGSFSKSMI